MTRTSKYLPTDSTAFVTDPTHPLYGAEVRITGRTRPRGPQALPAAYHLIEREGDTDGWHQIVDIDCTQVEAVSRTDVRWGQLREAREARAARREASRLAFEAEHRQRTLGEAMLADLQDDAWRNAPTTLSAWTEIGAGRRELYTSATLRIEGLPEPSRNKGRYYTPRLEVTLYVRTNPWTKAIEAQVNWSAIGSSSPAVTRAYANLMQTGAALAEAKAAALRAEREQADANLEG